MTRLLHAITAHSPLVRELRLRLRHAEEERHHHTLTLSEIGSALRIPVPTNRYDALLRLAHTRARLEEAQAVAAIVIAKGRGCMECTEVDKGGV